MKIKTIVWVSIALFVVLTGCSKAKQSQKQDGPLTMTMLYPDNASYPLKKDWLVLDAIEKATGVTLDLIIAPDTSSDYEAKRQIIFNSGNIPDIVYSKTPAKPEDVLNGLLLPISDYVDQMPNLKKFLTEFDYASDVDNLRELDGKFYSLPIKADTRRMPIHQWLLRLDAFEKNGIPVPKTLDDIYQAGLKLKKAYPDSFPIINRFGAGNILSMVGTGFGTAAGWSLDPNGYIYDKQSDQWVFAPTSDKYKEMLLYMKKLLDSGILDPEFITLDSIAYEQKVIDNSTFILLDWIGNQVRYNIEGRKKDPDFNVQPIFPIIGPSNDAALPRALKYEAQVWLLPKTLADDPRFKEKLAFIDWFYSEEASVVTTFGIEGVSYELKDGHLQYLQPDFPKRWGLQNNALNVRRHPDFFLASNSQEIANLADEIEASGLILGPQPKVRYNSDEIEDMKLMVAPVSDYVSSMTQNFIFGKKSLESDWASFVQECKDKGSEKIGAIINTAWERQN